MAHPSRITPLGLFSLGFSLLVLLATIFAPQIAALAAGVNCVLLGLALVARPSSSEQRPPRHGDEAYEVLDKIGEGGMGEVFRAEQAGLRRMVALKRIKGSQADGVDYTRFRREARVLSTLTNPHTIKVFDAGVRKDGSLFYAMELLDGQDLESLINDKGPIEPARVIHILRQATMSVGEAHKKGLVHRDIKPANLMVCRYGGELDFVKVLDFGLVKGAMPDGDSLQMVSHVGTVAGTPAFIAPECILGAGNVDGRSDLYSLAAIGHFLLTGRYLFDIESPMGMIRAQLNEEPPAAAARSPYQVPEQLDALLLRWLRKKPEDRPGGADRLLDELDALSPAHPWTREMAGEIWELMPSERHPQLSQPPLPSEVLGD